MEYDRDFIAASGGAYATLAGVARTRGPGARAANVPRPAMVSGTWMRDVGIVLSREIHMSDDAGRFTSLRQPLRPNARLISPDMIREIRKGDYLVLHEGKTIHQFSDRRTTLPRYAISLAELADKPSLSRARSITVRPAARSPGRPMSARRLRRCLPPGVLCGHTISVERRPARRPNAAALSLVGVMNSFAFDWLLRQKAASPCEPVYPVRIAGA